MKRILLFCLVWISSVAYACDLGPSRMAIQGALATGGSLGIGIVNYTPITELGLTLSGQVNNASQKTRLIVPVIFGGFRKALQDQTYFAYGLDLVTKFGKDTGQTIHSDYQIGPYVSLEQEITHHLMLAGWIQPYSFQYEKKGETSTSTHRFFATGGVAINYLFSS